MNSLTRDLLGLGPMPTIDQIINAYAQVSGVRLEDVVGPSKVAAITAYRHELMYLIRRLDPAASFALIGRFIGGRDMATVQEAIVKVEQRLQREPGYAAELAALARQIIHLAREQVPPDFRQAQPWQLVAALGVLRDAEVTDADARKAALAFLTPLETRHAS